MCQVCSAVSIACLPVLDRLSTTLGMPPLTSYSPFVVAKFYLSGQPFVVTGVGVLAVLPATASMAVVNDQVGMNQALLFDV